jgi:hypothetical protein
MQNYKNLVFPKPSVFESFLKGVLSATEYEGLNTQLQLQPNVWTRFRNAPQTMRLGLVLSLAEILELPPHHLLKQYGCGAQGMTAGECLSLEQMEVELEKTSA